MRIDWNRSTLRLAANPLAVARQVDSLPQVALCILRLLDGHKTVQDALRMSPVEEETARAILRRLTELGLASPVCEQPSQDVSRVDSLSAPLKAWIAEHRSRRHPVRLARMAPSAPPRPAPQGMDEVDALLAELAAAPSVFPSPPPAPPLRVTQVASAVQAPATAMVHGASHVSEELRVESFHGEPPHTLEEALRCHLDEQCATVQWSDQDLAFFDSYVPEEPMTDTFSDLLSAPSRRR